MVEQADKAGRSRSSAWYRVEPFAGCLVVTVGGEVDATNAAELHAVLHSAARRSPRLVIDLSPLTFIDSTGIGALLRVRKRVQASGDSLVLVHPPGPVRRILHGTHLDTAFTIFDSLSEALGHTSRSKLPH